ncbi:MAG: iron-sulfur cluster assembly scaffold protein [Sphingomonas sp.]|nr:MAG: iron-sulfur cluster assembly scaffold protein [Sphingomonas sp.]
MDAPLYNSEILRLAASIPHATRLAAPQSSAQRTSPICGSRVTVDLALDSAGHVVRFGQEVRACALGQASASILGRHILGETAQSLAEARDLLRGWLKADGPRSETLPATLAARFPELALLLPARAHPARHPSILLAFEASAAAAADALQPAPAG